MKLSDYKSTSNMMCLFKGESGSGKTIAASSFPEPIYLLSCDGRVAPIKSFPKTKNRNIEFDIVTSYDFIMTKLEELERKCSFSTVIIDPLTGFARITMDYLFGNRGSSKIKSDSEVGGIPIMGIAEYNGESSGIASLLMSLRIIRNHGANVILSSHVVTAESKQLDGRFVTTRRLLTGGNKIAAEIPSYFDEVYHFYGPDSTRQTYRAITSNAGEDYARTSFYGLEKEIDFTDKLFYEELSKAITTAQTNQEFFGEK